MGRSGRRASAGWRHQDSVWWVSPPGAARDHDQVEKKLSIFQMGLSLKSEKIATQLRGMKASSLCQIFVADGYTDLSIFSLPSCLTYTGKCPRGGLMSPLLSFVSLNLGVMLKGLFPPSKFLLQN